jgi:hypothetical protein
MAIPYQPPGVLTVNQLQSAPLVPQLSTGVEIPSLIGYSAPGTAGYPTQLDVITASTAFGTVALTKVGVEFMGNATVVPQAALVVYNPNTYQTIGYGNYGVVNTTSVTAVGATVTTTAVETIAYAGTTTATSTNGSTIGTAQYRYGISYILNLNNAGGNSYYESGIGTTYTYITLTNAASNITLTGLPVGATSAGIGTVVGVNVYRSQNLNTSDAPYWGPWGMVYNNGTPQSLSGATNGGTVTFAGNGQGTVIDTNASVSNNPIPVTSMNPGDSVQVSYQYADQNYYLPTLFNQYQDIEAKYGPAFNSDGTISSQLSFGAKLAMLNGASRVVCTAVSASDSQWLNAFQGLANDHDSTIIVPLTGSESIHASAAAHCTSMQSQNIFRTAIFGIDGTTSRVTQAALQAAAGSYNRKDIQYVSPSIFRYYNPKINIENQIGGQYAAAAVAGMHAARGPADSLTRQVVAGFSSIGDPRSLPGMNADAGNGLTVLEAKGGAIRIRHDISTAPANVNTREWPVIQQTYNMIRNILGIYDDSVVGQYKSNSTGLLAVQNITNGYLRSLVSKGQLDSYSGLNVSFNPSDPTAVNVTWTYKPIYTILYVSITIGLDLSSGTSNVTTTVANSATNGNLLL